MNKTKGCLIANFATVPLKIAGLAESANFDGFEAQAEQVTADAEQGNFLGQALIINVNGEKNVRNLAVQASDGFLYGQIVVDNRQDGRSAVFGFQDEGSIKGNQGAVLWSGSDRN